MQVARNIFRPTNRDAVEQVAGLYEALHRLLSCVEYVNALKGDLGDEAKAAAHAALANARGAA
jgi:hypothetical protein